MQCRSTEQQWATSDGELSEDVLSPTTVTGKNIAGCAQACSDRREVNPASRRQTFSKPRLTPQRRSIAEMFTPGSALSARIRAFSSSLPIPPLASTGDHLDPPVDSIMPGFIHGFIHDSNHGTSAISNDAVPLLSMTEFISRSQSAKEGGMFVALTMEIHFFAATNKPFARVALTGGIRCSRPPAKCSHLGRQSDGHGQRPYPKHHPWKRAVPPEDWPHSPIWPCFSLN